MQEECSVLGKGVLIDLIVELDFAPHHSQSLGLGRWDPLKDGLAVQVPEREGPVTAWNGMN